MRNKKLNWRLKTIVAILLTGTLLPFSSAYAIHYQGPLVVDANYVKKHGSVITGSYQGTTSVPAISVTNMSTPIVIANCTLTGPGDLIYAINSNVSVITTTGTGSNPNIANQVKGMFVHAVNPISLTVSKNTINNVSMGVYVSGYSGNRSVSQTITINNNTINNIDGRPSNGNGGYATNGSYNSHGIELLNVTGVPGIVIDWNQIINVASQSQSGQMINLIDASGTVSSPILVHDNYTQGAYPTDPGVDAYSGGGILVDGSANDTAASTSAYINIYNNQVVSTANVGIAIAAGHNNSVYSNRVISSGIIANGTFVAGSSAIGMYNWNYYEQSAAVFNNNNIHDNVVGLLRKVSGVLQRADYWLPGQTTSVNNVAFTPNNSSAPTLANEAAEFAAWQKKLANQDS
jgi:hypothetical protein